MSKTIIQYRFYNTNNTKNYPIYTANQPADINITDLATGSAFLSEEIKAEYGLIVQLGIQALPGTQFYLNQNVDPIIIGATGIFELDLTDKSAVYKLSFDKDSLEIINDNENGHLIVDAVYDTEV